MVKQKNVDVVHNAHTLFWSFILSHSPQAAGSAQSGQSRSEDADDNLNDALPKFFVFHGNTPFLYFSFPHAKPNTLAPQPFFSFSPAICDLSRTVGSPQAVRGSIDFHSKLLSSWLRSKVRAIGYAELTQHASTGHFNLRILC